MFVERFNELLEERELNRKQFSERSGIPYTTVIGWTRLNRLPDYTALIRLADFFDCSIDYIVGRQEDGDPAYSSAEGSETERILLRSFRKLDPENKELIVTLARNLSVPRAKQK